MEFHAIRWFPDFVFPYYAIDLTIFVPRCSQALLCIFVVLPGRKWIGHQWRVGPDTWNNIETWNAAKCPKIFPASNFLWCDEMCPNLEKCHEMPWNAMKIHPWTPLSSCLFRRFFCRFHVGKQINQPIPEATVSAGFMVAYFAWPRFVSTEASGVFEWAVVVDGCGWQGRQIDKMGLKMRWFLQFMTMLGNLIVKVRGSHGAPFLFRPRGLLVMRPGQFGWTEENCVYIYIYIYGQTSAPVQSTSINNQIHGAGINFLQ